MYTTGRSTVLLSSYRCREVFKHQSTDALLTYATLYLKLNYSLDRTRKFNKKCMYNNKSLTRKYICKKILTSIDKRSTK